MARGSSGRSSPKLVSARPRHARACAQGQHLIKGTFMHSQGTHYTDLEPVARHEAAHVLHGHLVGHLVEWVSIGRSRGCTTLRYPVRQESLASTWHTSPLLWAGELMRIVGTIRAGSLFEGRGTDISADDRDSLHQWRDAYVGAIGTRHDWARLEVSVDGSLLRWRHRDSVQRAVTAIAAALLGQ